MLGRGSKEHRRPDAASNFAAKALRKRAAGPIAARPVRRYGVGNVTARCGDGCLDRLVVSVRRGKIRPLPINAGAMVLGAAGALSPQLPSSASSPAAQSAGTPVLLLGMLSGSAPRREALRCTWMRVPVIARDVRVLFIVGKANAEKSSDVLPVDVVEGAFMRSKHDQAHNTSRTFDVKKLIRTGSITTYWKLVEWLQYAARQPEPMVGRADDDVFISPRMLLAHTRLLLEHATPPRSPLLFAGVFEWYSWRTRTLMSTGFGLSAGASRTRRKKSWRNCTATGTGRTSLSDPCIGPVAFAKGPLMLMSTAAVRAVVGGPLFARDVAQAHALSEGRAQAYKGPGSGRIDDDVQLGYWMSQLPNLSVVTFRRYMAWHDRWKAGVTDMLPRLLLAHKVPWARFSDLLNRTEALWLRSSRVHTRLICEGPPCADCAHVAGQSGCVVDVEIESAPALANASTCFPKCKFTKAVPPAVPEHCWNRSAGSPVGAW